MQDRKQARLKTARLEARVDSKQKQLFQYPANIPGHAQTDFMIASTQEAPNCVIHEHTVIELSQTDSELLMNALTNPPKPSESLLKAAKAYTHSLDTQVQ